ncbi:CD209 antigen-like protein C isoform X2 [Melopsittacus undulatus]|uniref:CD209 antigen-like protein C isoform X2 n=1 Tax=Melopsittacus undulatus TaxID=13146 RepID=UPI00146B20BD|nr:CD209 antigen-like protein C isoform X2 [Melopsittacus undulatus]
MQPGAAAQELEMGEREQEAPKGASLPNRAIALLSLLLALSFVLLMALSIVNLRRVSAAWEALEEARMRDESSHTTAWLNLSQVQHALDKQLSKEVKAVRIQLLNVSQEVEKLQWRMAQCETGCGKELRGRLQDLEARNALEPLQQQLEGVKRELSVVLEETRSFSRILCPTCPAGWLQFARTCYFFSSTKKSWWEAKEFCGNLNGHLATVSSEQENKFLANHIMENRIFWLGLTDSYREGHWQWEDGSSTSISFWNTGEPNNVGEHGEDCATIFSNGRWNDVSCSNKEAWICERSC